MDATTIPANTVSFRDFLFKDKRNRTILILAAVAMVIQWGVFKYFYPFASFIHGDSFSYIYAADRNLSINKYLIGYSKFLRLFSVFSTSDTALVTFQYISIQCSALLLLFSLFYFHKPYRIAQYILICLMVLNPLFLHLANLISSDCIFVAISFTWFSLLLWIIHKPNAWIILLQALTLFLAFTIRYNGLIYLLITLISFWLTKIPLRLKIAGIAASFLFIGLFIAFTGYQYKKLTGHWQYSPFSGWQFANNAMYAYRYVSPSDREPVPEKFQTIDKMVREFFDSTRDVNRFPSEKEMASTYYMWTKNMPLIKYKNIIYKNDTINPDMKSWAAIAPFYKQYGLYIIAKHPVHFLKYFIWPNSQKYYAPPTEFLGVYNSGKDSIAKVAENWFAYKTRKIITRTESNEIKILEALPVLSGIINAAMFLLLIFYLVLKGWQFNIPFNKTILMGITFWLANAGFTILASSAALRFQSFPLMLTTTFSILLVDWMVGLMKIMNAKEKNKNVNERLSPEIA
jgi:hypothetical protein